MKELTLETLLAVFEEIYGFWLFWGMVAAALVVTVLFVWVLIRDHKLEARTLVQAELFAPVGAVAAIVFVFFMTSSGLRDMGGPIDVMMLVGIGAAGAVGLTILAYVARALVRPPRG
ncbi:MAG: DUF5368 domain-containing protein [Rhodobacterales bacterium]|nr:DUF5368 domain-containing protein [Rhodobacterales bacterium]